MYLQGVQALRGCRESGSLHLDELVGEDREDRCLLVDVVRDVHVGRLGPPWMWGVRQSASKRVGW